MIAPFTLREEWLHAAVTDLRPDFEAVEAALPETIRVSVGFPKRGRQQTIGQCWAARTSTDQATNIFISPILDQPGTVLAVLVHELAHAADDCRSGHRGRFAQIARDMGLVGPMTATRAGEELAGRLNALATSLGAYPHGAIAAGAAVANAKQTTRMLKTICPACGYIARVSGKWLWKGPPICPTHRAPMVIDF